MKKVPILLLILCLLLTGCGEDVQLPLSTAEPYLTVCIPPEQAFWTPFFREYEHRSGTLLRVLPEPADVLMSSMEAETGPDVLLGYDPAELSALSGQLRDPETVGWQVPVIVCNPHLIRKNPPAGFRALSDPQWTASLSFADPGENAFSREVLELLSRMQPDGQAIESFSAALSGLSGRTSEALGEICSGTTALGVVPESEALLATAQGIRLSVIYPEEGSFLFPIPVWVALKSRQIDAAGEFLTFLTEETTQAHLWSDCRIRPAEGTEWPPGPVFCDNPNPGMREQALMRWHGIREVQP